MQFIRTFSRKLLQRSAPLPEISLPERLSSRVHIVRYEHPAQSRIHVIFSGLGSPTIARELCTQSRVQHSCTVSRDSFIYDNDGALGAENITDFMTDFKKVREEILDDILCVGSFLPSCKVQPHDIYTSNPPAVRASLRDSCDSGANSGTASQSRDAKHRVTNLLD